MNCRYIAAAILIGTLEARSQSAGVPERPATAPILSDAVVCPAPKVQTESMQSGGDSADDPAIWVHPSDPSRSLILGTDKHGGLNAYALDGTRVQAVSEQ